MERSHTYKLAEEFHSIQGEGVHAGTQMHFIRLAGCNVGEYIPPAKLLAQGQHELALLRGSNPELSICTNAIGQSFLCDTAYNKVVARHTPADLIDATWERHICLTGGEPFIHDLEPILHASALNGLTVHVETSGTIQFPEYVERYRLSNRLWVTCSPKRGYITANWPSVDEFKFVVHSGDPASVTASDIMDVLGEDACDWDTPVFIQPVNSVHSVDMVQLTHTMAVLQLKPAWRLSVQLHKLLGMQ